MFDASPFLVLVSLKWLSVLGELLLTFYFHLLVIFKEKQVKFHLLALSCD